MGGEGENERGVRSMEAAQEAAQLGIVLGCSPEHPLHTQQ